MNRCSGQALISIGSSFKATRESTLAVYLRVRRHPLAAGRHFLHPKVRHMGQVNRVLPMNLHPACPRVLSQCHAPASFVSPSAWRCETGLGSKQVGRIQGQWTKRNDDNLRRL